MGGRHGDVDRERYERGLDDYHDPTAGIGGAPPARSALTLRLWLAGFGCALFIVAAILFAAADAAAAAAVCGALAVLAAANLAWVAYRKLRGEPG
ncbi:MAG TPA: DUF6343 family protein [Jiangellaceae bacterium]|nr:DUF6343 family protein [Jiangellaceae bacterium]